MLQTMMPWIKLVAGLGGMIALISVRPIELALLALGVFALAYFGLPEFNEFVQANPALIGTVAVTVVLGITGIRLGPIGVTLSLVAIGVGAYIVLRQLPFPS